MYDDDDNDEIKGIQVVKHHNCSNQHDYHHPSSSL